ncbi:MurR/RpiR family transcriptional regulator [Mesorhizobium sp. M6A.T.Cr.TU.016.01.1.1]|uniref:MurR/RpiR family transcriptional regulator n=1 Tax=Mesorhizobium sp. M6A.T.Cr.TU.016.01.1.1 TaxID=2493677 RepID=UPI000F7588DC|nr:MurR/RpiR family transcriptional regulator [Mesorhizobium sp. M6A.T.Cr.TU.016.01.1.1]AZO68030.1 MurR/RpiR family transcriptional regulator [Mesorhizobium sp. M6A.T.Cr.TU.016.01.1.1]
MSHDLLRRLEDNLEGFTQAERMIANFILTNRGGIAFETANSIAAKLQVSSITVGRFSRKMGYRHFKDLKAGLQTTMSGVPWLVGDQVTEFVETKGEGNRTKRSLELELAGIIEVYAMAESENWKRIVALLAHSHRVHVVGFQTERGVAAMLANLLQYARDGVSLVDTSAGNYHEIFATESESHCLVLFDVRRYSEQTYDLAARASREGIPLVMITDKFCDWIRKFTSHVIAVSTEVELFWSSPVSLSCAVNLLVNDVIGSLGQTVEKRLERLSELYQSHTGHVGSPAMRKAGKP